ncbi:MAG: GNAT family protein [Actinomycetes bacterium]|jgi:N-acetyltransferase
MESEHLKLEVLTSGRIPELFAALGTDPDIYRWLPFAAPTLLDDLATVLNGFIRDTNSGLRIAYAVVLKSSGLAIGTTSFLDLNPTQKSLEIGSTFYAKEHWRSFVNTECKILMLTEAFEVRQAERVTLKTDSMNERSRAAILRLGATFEGILRHHMLRPDGTWRDSAYFSILKSEWPAIEEHLANKLQSQLGIE